MYICYLKIIIWKEEHLPQCIIQYLCFLLYNNILIVNGFNELWLCLERKKNTSFNTIIVIHPTAKSHILPGLTAIPSFPLSQLGTSCLHSHLNLFISIHKPSSNLRNHLNIQKLINTFQNKIPSHKHGNFFYTFMLPTGVSAGKFCRVHNHYISGVYGLHKSIPIYSWDILYTVNAIMI